MLVGFSFAASTALAIVYTYQRATETSRLTRARVLRRSEGIGLRSALREAGRSPIPFIDSLPLSNEARERMEWELDRAGVPLRVNEYLGIRMGAAVGGVVAGFTVASAFGLPISVVLIATFAALVGGWMLPRVWVARKRAKRLEAIEKQLPDALTTLAKSLRAGTGLLQAMAYAAEETPAPLGPELDQTLRELRLGANAETAFSELSARVGSNDLDIAVTAVVIQRTVGGNLSEILTNVSTTIRERAKLYGEIKVLTSRQRLTGNLMALIPVLIAAAFIAINPDIGRLLVNTVPGRISLGIGLAFELLGLLLIRKFGQIEV